MTATRLVLVMPPQQGLLDGFATGLISLANYVKSHRPETDVQILDLSHKQADTIREQIVSKFGWDDAPTVFGITTTTASYRSAVDVSRQLRDLYPKCLIVLGGHHASADSRVVLKCQSGTVDAVALGEGEQSLVDLLTFYPELEPARGIAFLRDGVYRETPPPPPLTQSQLDDLPVTYLGNGLFNSPGKFNHVTYVSARGCPLPCAFCAVAKKAIRYKSVDAVVRDIGQLLDKGFARIAIEDNFFAHTADRTREICDGLRQLWEERRRTFTWDCQSRVEAVAREGTIQSLAESGCDAVYLGVESLNPDHLIYLRKTPQPERYLDQLINTVVPGLVGSPVACHMNLQMGLRGESDAHHENTLRLLRVVGATAVSRGKAITLFPQLHVVYPGTEHFQQGIAEGRFPGDVFESFTTWECAQPKILTWLGEYFAHGAGGLPEGLLSSEALRSGCFEVDRDAMFAISAFLGRMDRIPGIHVFRYGSYLVTGAESDPWHAADIESARDSLAANTALDQRRGVA